MATMRASAQQLENLRNDVRVRSHTITADEPREDGGDDTGPSPQELLAASLASCTAITMEMYAQRKGWAIGDMSVEVTYEPAQRGSPTRFQMRVKLPKELPQEQQQRLMQIVAKCPVHRTLEGEVAFDERVELVGALEPTPTFVTNYAIYPFVGLIEPGFAWVLQEREVAQVLELPLERLRAAYAERRLVRKGIPFRTPTYEVEGHLIWGATGRILQDLLGRI